MPIAGLEGLYPWDGEVAHPGLAPPGERPKGLVGEYSKPPGLRALYGLMPPYPVVVLPYSVIPPKPLGLSLPDEMIGENEAP